MNKNYCNKSNINSLLMESREDNKKRHEYELLDRNRDTFFQEIKSSVEGIKK